MGTNIKPYHNNKASKKEQIASMFDAIAKRYDFLNHFLSLGIDIIWRKKAIKEIATVQPKKILDIATGTGDLAIEASKLRPEQIIGVDISNNMLSHGRNKVKKKNLDHLIEMTFGDAEDLSFSDESFDAITAGFGVRNFEHLNKGLSEMHRVLKTDGKIAIIEPAEPVVFPFKQIYNLYFKGLLPIIGKLFSDDQSAYSYLPESVEAFPTRTQFLEELKKVGFKNVEYKSLTFGVAILYLASK